MTTKSAHIWIGNFQSENALDAYFEEQYDSDDEPINKFAFDQNIEHYDHDFAERIFHKSQKPISAVLYHGYFDDSKDQLIESIGHANVEMINTTVMVIDDRSDWIDVKTSDYSLIYLGCFDANL